MVAAAAAEVGVEVLEVGDRQAAQRHPTDVRQHVASIICSQRNDVDGRKRPSRVGSQRVRRYPDTVTPRAEGGRSDGMVSAIALASA